MLRNLRFLFLTAVAVSTTVGSAAAQTAFTAGNLVIYRVGVGAPTTLVNTGSAVFLDEYTPSGTLVQSVPLPSNFIASGTATSEGFITTSPNGQYLSVTGYTATAPVTGGVASSTSVAVPRSVVVLDSTATIQSRTDLTNFGSGNNIRSAVTTNGTDIWVAGPTGVAYTTAGATTATSVATTNSRQVNIVDGQLYVSSSSGSIRLATVGTGTPTSGPQTVTNLPGFPTSGSPYGYFFADLSTDVAGVDTVYLADDSNTAGGGGIKKFSLEGGTWVARGTVGVAADVYRGLTGVVSGTTVTLYTTRKGGSAAAGGGELASLVDTSGYAADLTATPSAALATAGANISFRGIAFVPAVSAPVPEPASVLGVAAVGLVGWAVRRRRQA